VHAGYAGAAVGLATLAAGAVAVFVSNNEAGAAALVAAGTVLTGLVVLGDRLESLEYGGMKLQLLAADKFKAAEAAELIGDPVLAETLREEAQALIDQARPPSRSHTVS
jgi:hypothetical protein